MRYVSTIHSVELYLFYVMLAIVRSPICVCTRCGCVLFLYTYVTTCLPPSLSCHVIAILPNELCTHFVVCVKM